MDENFGPDLITLSDDEGTEYTFEVLDAVETDTGRYIALLPTRDDPTELLEEEDQLVLLKVASDDSGEEYYEELDDDEYETMTDLFAERLADAFEIETED